MSLPREYDNEVEDVPWISQKWASPDDETHADDFKYELTNVDVGENHLSCGDEIISPLRGISIA